MPEPWGLLFTREVGRVVRTTRALVGSHLWERAERPRAIDLTFRDVRCGDRRRRLFLLDPVLERGEHVECGGAVAPAAVVHAGHHDEAIAVRQLRSAADLVEHTLVVLRAAGRRNLWIGPAVVLNQLAAA